MSARQKKTGHAIQWEKIKLFYTSPSKLLELKMRKMTYGYLVCLIGITYSSIVAHGNFYLGLVAKLIYN